MEPNIHAGGFVLVNRASYGFSRKSFDLFPLPIAGRWPDLSPRRGDVIVFRLPSDGRTPYVKRVIGIGGDTVQIKDDELWINGTRMPRSMAGIFRTKDLIGNPIAARLYREALPGGRSFTHMELQGARGPLANTQPLAVPQRQLLVLGDNRDNSLDSRTPAPLHGVGLVPVEFVIGRVVATFGGN
jgi:signal peptidase I